MIIEKRFLWHFYQHFHLVSKIKYFFYSAEICEIRKLGFADLFPILDMTENLTSSLNILIHSHSLTP